MPLFFNAPPGWRNGRRIGLKIRFLPIQILLTEPQKQPVFTTQNKHFVLYCQRFYETAFRGILLLLWVWVGLRDFAQLWFSLGTIRHSKKCPMVSDDQEKLCLVALLLIVLAFDRTLRIRCGVGINKKTALDRAISNEDINGNTLSHLSGEFIRTINLIKRMFPDLRQTRFSNSVEFYTLFMLVWEMDREGYILRERRRNRAAFAFLRKLSNGVDELRDQLRHAKPAKPSQRIYSDYLLTVLGDTDSSATRERRREILRGLLFSLYDRRDERRIFSSEQRRIIWNSDEKRVCAKCRKPLTWDDFTVDHIVAWVKGGRTSLKNAQLMHRECNSRKGAR